MVSRHGRLLAPEEIRTASKQDVAVFGPMVQFRYQRELEPPDPSEGFSRIEVVTFERSRDPSLDQPGGHRLVRRRASPQPIGLHAPARR